jgi:hypothetical protein
MYQGAETTCQRSVGCDDSPALILLAAPVERQRWPPPGFKMAVPHNRALLAEICLRAGRLDEGFAALDEGAATSRETGMSYFDAELLRLRGELLGASGAPTAEVHRVLQEAIDIATRQGATALVRREKGPGDFESRAQWRSGDSPG